MAALTLKSIRLCTLAPGLALALAVPALAGDVSVQLDAGSGFSIKNSTGATERLRLDEATGNLSRNGALFVHTTGSNTTFVGVNAGNTSTTGFANSGFGVSALRSNTTGFSNSAFGYNALRVNTAGYGNSAAERKSVQAGFRGPITLEVTIALRASGSRDPEAAAGNAAFPSYAHAEGPDPLLAEHARWALARLGQNLNPPARLAGE